jgi:N-acetyl sugar amidotransferase
MDWRFRKLKYCKKCLQPNTRPNIYFDENQVCGACLYEESKNSIDWKQRKSKLNEIADWAKTESEKRNVAYDCVIGVSGGKDSTFQAFYVKEKLGLHPLLVNCMPGKITEAGKQNIENLSSKGFDILHIRPNPVVAKKLAKKGFYEYGNMQKSSEYCLWASAYRIAIQMSIPLIVQGENAALTLGVSKGLNVDDDAFGVFNSNTLNGGIVDLWLDDDITQEMLYLYKAPSKEDYDTQGIRSIWLQYYTKEWSQSRNADFAIARGLMGRNDENLHDIGMFRRNTSLDCDLYIANQMIKYLKFGFGSSTDLVCYDIREGLISREDAIWLVNEYDGKCGEQYIQYACDYMDITKQEFWNVVDGFVNKDLFNKCDVSGKYLPKFTVGEDYMNGRCYV